SLRGDLDDDLLTVWSDNAAPTGSPTIPVRFFFGSVALTSIPFAIGRGRINDRHLPGFSIVEAAPTLLAIRCRFIFGIKTSQFARLCIGRAHLDWITVQAYPA